MWPLPPGTELSNFFTCCMCYLFLTMKSLVQATQFGHRNKNPKFLWCGLYDLLTHLNLIQSVSFPFIYTFYYYYYSPTQAKPLKVTKKSQNSYREKLKKYKKWKRSCTPNACQWPKIGGREKELPFERKSDNFRIFKIARKN